MHDTAYEHMRMCVDVYMRRDQHYKILDLGSRKSVAAHDTHRNLLSEYDVEYVGVDVSAGGNVDVVMTKHYRIPAKSSSVDVVMCNQVFEHVAFPWTTFMEMARILKPGGLIFLIAPSRGQRHGQGDFWRYYPDSMRAFAAFSRIDLLETYVDLPPTKRNGRPDLAAVGNNYWGDAVGVFRKPQQYSKLVRIVGELLVWWSNRVGGVGHIKPPSTTRQRRLRIGETFSTPAKAVDPRRP